MALFDAQARDPICVVQAGELADTEAVALGGNFDAGKHLLLPRYFFDRFDPIFNTRLHEIILLISGHRPSLFGGERVVANAVTNRVIRLSLNTLVGADFRLRWHLLIGAATNAIELCDHPAAVPSLFIQGL